MLNICKDWTDPSQWAGVIDDYLSENYLFDWYKGLYVDAGLPRAKSQARDLSRGKSEPTEDYWLSELQRYAEQRAGEEITLVSDTFKENLIGVVRKTMKEQPQGGIEKLAKQILEGYQDIELWQARRIAQTETMIGLADAGDIAARTLDIRFNKQWCTSGMSNTRETHLVMDGEVVDQDEPFVLPDGDLMMYPHDGSLGASAGEIINCACDVIRIPI